MVPKIRPADELQLREIEAVGKDAMRFKEGDQVFETPGMTFGPHAEYCFTALFFRRDC